MNDKTLNKVITGLYEGSDIVVDTVEKVAYIASSNMPITANNVESVEQVNQSTESSVSIGGAALGTLAFGTGGAALGNKTSSTFLLEINWNGGATSLVKVNSKVYEAITIGMYKAVTDDRIAKHREEVQQASIRAEIILGIIGILYAIYYLWQSGI